MESKVADYQQQQASQQKQLERSKLEAQHAQRALRAAQQDASAGPSQMPLSGSALGGRLLDQSSPGMLDTDSWAEPASVEVSMPSLLHAFLCSPMRACMHAYHFEVIIASRHLTCSISTHRDTAKADGTVAWATLPSLLCPAPGVIVVQTLLLK